ncbi:hypothetical protein FH972_022315 [Carpinus fangiana]|uniref:RNA helicase n=1 Tax=Carpinus fangiana TaxID=176857 RepID=A0A5N6KSF7_9ROSI|nr:hypothetical protein FH972_022315 [Carpinus fangiana]
MPRRAASPALSEQEFDISNALLAGQDGNDSDASEDFAAQASIPKQNTRPGQILSDEDDSDDDEAFIAAQQAASNRKNASVKGKSSKKSGGFQSMGLNPQLLKAITRKGFSVPTPIQRKTVPLLLDGQDVVGMARTGSGKTAAFVIPMIERLRSHSVKVGARAIVMSPSRELALQTLKAVKDFGRGTDLRTILLVGGDSLEDQFSQMTTNPDIIIATPGRFLHLMVEMSLDLSSVRYVVFDEADRLFEMGFSTQLTEILYALPPSRQTMLFSATLPKSLVEFAKAGLKDPSLVRLDAESKVSPDLENAFFTVKSADKEGALVHILNDVIGIPQGQPTAKKQSKANVGKKRKRDSAAPGGTALDAPTEFSTIIFAATKHHVEYLSQLLRLSGFAVSYVYGSLDQTARKMQVDDFRAGTTNILVVTDVAARGIDIPMLANVINYDFPSQPKIFVHRVGRTARAGRKGWSYNLVQNTDLPYLLDLQLFLGKSLISGRSSTAEEQPANFAEDMVLGSIQRTDLEKSCEWVNKVLDDDEDLRLLRSVAAKGEKLYTRSRNAASSESVKRAKTLAAQGDLQETSRLYAGGAAEAEDVLSQRDQMLARISGFRPAETVFEIGRRGKETETTETIRRTREKISAKQMAAERAASVRVANSQSGAGTEQLAEIADAEADAAPPRPGSSLSDLAAAHGPDGGPDMDEVSDDELEITFPSASARSQGGVDAWHDAEHFMGYMPRTANAAEERGYGVHSGGNNKASLGLSASGEFVDAARGATMDLGMDESQRGFGLPSKVNQMRWDKRAKNYVSKANDEDGSKGARFIAGESGQKIAASFKSGRFDAWRRSHKLERMPRTGDVEKAGAQAAGGPGRGAAGGRGARGGHAGARRGARGGHFAERAPKRPDKYRDDYHKQKEKFNAARERAAGAEGARGGRGGGPGNVPAGRRVKSEIRGTDDIRKARAEKEKRRDKNARPAKKKRKM